MTQGTVAVLAPRLADAADLAAVHVETWREAYGSLLPEHFYDDAARVRQQGMWAQRLAAPGGVSRIRVAILAGRLVGFAVRGDAVDHHGHPPVREEQLFALYVLARWHGTGVGQALLDECLRGRPAQLWVAKENGRARRFYDKNGFEEDGTEQVDEDLDGLVEIRMVR